MNFNNRLSNTLANNIKLDSNVEHEAEKIAGGNIIWLVNRPAGVKIYVNSTPDRTGALVLNEANRGYKWEQLGEYGSLKLYDNFYIWTEGTNLNNDKIELQVSPNADVITPILGNTADKIDKISELEHIGDNVIFSLYKSQKTLIDTNRIKFLQYVNGAWDETTVEADWNWASKIYLSKICDFSMLTFDKNKWYRIILEGHADFGGENLADDSTESNSYYYTRASDSLHLDLINEASLNLNSAFTKLDNQPYIDNIFKSNANNPTIEKKTNFYCFWGYKRVNSRGQFNGSHFLNNSYTPGNTNFISEYSAPGFIFENMKLLIMSLKAYRAWGGDTNGRSLGRGFHFSIKVQIEVLNLLPDSKSILTNPYINNDI